MTENLNPTSDAEAQKPIDYLGFEAVTLTALELENATLKKLLSPETVDRAHEKLQIWGRAMEGLSQEESDKYWMQLVRQILEQDDIPPVDKDISSVLRMRHSLHNKVYPLASDREPWKLKRVGHGHIGYTTKEQGTGAVLDISYWVAGDRLNIYRFKDGADAPEFEIGGPGFRGAVSDLDSVISFYQWLDRLEQNQARDFILGKDGA